MVDLAGDAPRRTVRTSWTRRLLPRLAWTLSHYTATVVTALLGFALAWSFWLYEGIPENVLFTAAVTLTLGALIALLTRRPLFAAVILTMLVILVNSIAAAKMRFIGMVLHAYDIVFYLGSWSTVTYLWYAAPGYVMAFAAGVGALVGLGVLAWRADPVRLGRTRTAAVLGVALAVATYTGLTKPDRRHTQFYWNALYVSSFYGSWAETVETLWRGSVVEAASAANGPPFALDDACTPTEKPPHIVLIHQESVVQPGLFPTLAYDKSLDKLFQSSDGRVHKMRVETYGGASWLTEFSILTGLSTHSFGGMRPFVQSLLAGKIRDTMTESLTRCGYRNVLFYPMLKNFVSNSRFYDAVGLKEIFDMKAQRTKSEQERDRVYYANALDEMERHVKASEKPLFTYIQTMSVHWPYDWKFEPNVDVPGGGRGTDPDMSEYLRRVAMAKMDYDYLIAELKRRFPGEKVLVMHYGDHHPTATQKLLGHDPEAQVEDLTLDPMSKAFITYYAVEGINYALKPLPPHDVVDVPYLGAILLQQAGLPLSAPNRERLRLMQVCDGHYNNCPRRTEILAFHRRLLDSKLISAR